MPRFAHVAAVIALIAALCCGMPARAGVVAHLDPDRVFDPAAESIFAGLLEPAKTLTPVSAALFHAPVPDVAMEMPAAVVSSGSGTALAVPLQAYTPTPKVPATTPLRPLAVAAGPVAAPRLAAPPVHVNIAPPQVHFGDYRPYAPALAGVKEDVRVPVRIGAVQFSGLVHGSEQQSAHVDAMRAMQLCGTTDEAAACPYLRDEHTQTIAAGTDFDVRTGNTRVNLRLSGSVASVNDRDTAMYQYMTLDPNPQLDGAHAGSPDDTSLLYYPGLSQLVSHGVNAALAVPVSPVLTVGLQYDTAHYQGTYDSLLAPGLDARKDTYLGDVTYKLPNSSLITLSARQFRYQDTFSPNFNLTETRADLSFTVKF